MDFDTWIARIESEIASDVAPGAWRAYFDAGVSPIEAVMQSRENDT